MSTSTTAPTRTDFHGKRFWEVFRLDQETSKLRWRIVGSGVRGSPCDCLATAAVVQVLRDAGIHVRSSFMMPLDSRGCGTSNLDATFLDGGLTASTGDYWYGQRGTWISGIKALLLAAGLLELVISDKWRNEFDAQDIKNQDLLAELKEELKSTPVEDSGRSFSYLAKQ